MKTFADNSFFLLFDEIVRMDKPKDAPDVWSAAGVSWRHSRHSYEAHSYGFITEVYEITADTKSGWCLIVVKEHWWAGRNGEAIRTARWAKPLRGNRAAILSWLKSRQRELENTL